MARSNIIEFSVCHAPKSKSLWMVKSSNISVCSKASTGGALVLLAVMGEPCLSRYDNILWMMAGSVIVDYQINTVRFGLFKPNCYRTLGVGVFS